MGGVCKDPTPVITVSNDGGKCVPEQSATFNEFSTKVENISLDTDHYGLNKFASRMNGYDRICKELKRVIEPGVSQPQHSSSMLLVVLEGFCVLTGIRN